MDPLRVAMFAAQDGPNFLALAVRVEHLHLVVDPAERDEDVRGASDRVDGGRVLAGCIHPGKPLLPLQPQRRRPKHLDAEEDPGQSPSPRFSASPTAQLRSGATNPTPGEFL
jgi:hypothetical protein